MCLPAKGCASLVAREDSFPISSSTKSPTLFVYSFKLRSGQYEFITHARSMDELRTSSRGKPECTHFPYHFHLHKQHQTKDASTRAMKLLQYIRVYLGRSVAHTLLRTPVRHNGSTRSLWRTATRLAGSKLSGQGAKFLFKVSTVIHLIAV